VGVEDAGSTGGRHRRQPTPRGGSGLVSPAPALPT
jgi:hypothetical protein